jgi:hypothetical protein
LKTSIKSGILKNQLSKSGENTKEIHNTITNFNQQNREYYSLRFSEVQKELSGMKVELGKIE